MKQKDKELLLKDLCARLPYMPKVKITYQQQGIKGIDEGNVSFDFIEKIVNDLRNGVIIDMQIYLRPMSSITEKEISDLQKITSQFCFNTFDNSAYVGATDDGFCSVEEMSNILNYLNSHHFDYRNLIECGLAIKVTEDNNPYKK